MDDVIKTIKSLEDSGLLIDGATETLKHELKKKKQKRISWCFNSTYVCFIDCTYGFFIGTAVA